MLRTGPFAANAAACASAALFNLGRIEEARVSLARAKALDASVFDVHPQFAPLLTELASLETSAKEKLDPECFNDADDSSPRA